MNKRQKILRISGTLIVAILLSGAVCDTLSSAVGLSIAPHWAYLGAFAGALLCGMCAFSTGAAIAATALAALGGGAWALFATDSPWGARALFSAIKLASVEGLPALTAASGALAFIIAALFGVLIYILLSDRGGATTALAACAALGVCVVCCAVNKSLSLLHALPAFIGACAALANSAESRGTLGHIKALIPALMAVLVAFLIAPGEGATFAPLEDAATYVKQLYEDYFNYTQERVAFSITDQGFDHYGTVNDRAVHKLGGPANPDPRAVMRVETARDILLRGTVRGTYTGYSWEDTTVKARHLYYDFTRRSARERAFSVGMADELPGYGSAFRTDSAAVTLLRDASSTLFVPGRLVDFDMDMRNAVYYNTVGELFMARSARNGDEYLCIGESVNNYAALSELMESAPEDPNYADAAARYLQLPGGIDPEVENITLQLIVDAQNDAEIALIIMEALKKNCTYATDVEYPPKDEDFVSYFLLKYRKGYCSYFASAMTVMCRIAGVPARYVEGYSVRAEADGTTNVTGENAHAWCEVYLRGVGWVAYDATPGENEHGGGAPDTDPMIEPTPTPAPPDISEPSEDPGDSSAEPTIEPTAPPSAPEHSPQPSAPTPPDAASNSGSSAVTWIILIIILIILMLAAFVLWVKYRLDRSNPVKIIERMPNPERNMLMLYRAILTLLSTISIYPAGGESPEAFAQRLARTGVANPDFEEFAKNLSVARYSRAKATKEIVALGLRAYVRFEKRLRGAEKIRFAARRALRGIGSYDQIP